MRVVIDTNVIVSGLLKADSNPSVILNLALEEKVITPCLNEAILAEYQLVLGYGKFKKHLPQEAVARFLKAFKKISTIIADTPELRPLPDPDDTKFLACAVAANADVLITGNQKHFPKRYRGVVILSPTEFLHMFAEHIQL